MSKKTKAKRADWSLAGGGAASTTALAALGLAATAGVGSAADITAWWGAAGAAAGGLSSVAAGAAKQAGPGWILHRLGSWVGAGAWLSWCLATTPWDVNVMLALGVGAAVSGGTSVLVRRSADGSAAATSRPGTALVLGSTATAAREWEERLARQTRRKGFQVTDVAAWPSGAGYTLTVIPPSGITDKQLRPYLDALAGDARLPQGCGVEIVAGPDRGSVRLQVATVNRLSESIPYPSEYAETSILEPLTLGEHRDSSPATVRWREHSALFSATKGAGKTTLLNVATAEAGRCRDALVWHIDLTGAGLTRPWLDPWLTGESERPAIDWAVRTEDEALEMVQAALRISKDRKASAWEKKKTADSTLMPVSRDLPEIVLVVDEAKSLLAPGGKGTIAKIRAGLEELQDIARDSAVNPILSTLRATQDALSPSIKVQATCRVAMAGTEDSELAYLLGWKNYSNADLAGPGTGFLTSGGDARPFRVYNLLPSRIAELARIIAARRPELDAASTKAAGKAYAGRYAAMNSFTDTPAGSEDVEPTPVRPVLRAVPSMVTAATWLDDTPQAPPAPQSGGGPAGWALPTRTTTMVEEIPEASVDVLQRALEAIDSAGDTRIPSAELAAALGYADPAALAEALRPHGVRAKQFERSGRKVRGYDRTQLADALRSQKSVTA